MSRSHPRCRSWRAPALLAGVLVLTLGISPPRASWGELPVGVRPTAERVEGGPIYVVLTVLIDDPREPAAEAAAVSWLLDRLDTHAIARVSVSTSPLALRALDDAAPAVMERLAARRPALSLHSRPPQPQGGGSLDWQMYAYDPLRHAFERDRVAPTAGGGDLGDLLRRRQVRSAEDSLLETLDVRLPTEPELFVPPARIVAAGLGLPSQQEAAPVQSADVRAWQEAEAAVVRHAAGEGAIAAEAEAAALDDLARMASLAALSGVDLPSVPGVSDFVHGVPRVASRPWTGAGPADHAALGAALEEDPRAARAALGVACSGLARALDARGTLGDELARRVASIPEDQSVVLGLAWPLQLEHRAAPWHPTADTARDEAGQAAVRESLDAVLAILARDPRVRFVAPGQATQWKPENRGVQLSQRVFALPPESILGTVKPAEVEVLHRRARIEDLRRR